MDQKNSLIKRVFKYMNNQTVDIRIRMMFFLEYASFIACFVGTVCMVLLKQPIETMIPNIILFVMSFISLYLSHVKKKYDLSTFFLIVGCANIALPWMFFSAGGNESGMLIWMIFSVVVICLMASEKIRFLMAAVTIIEDLACICIGQFWPESVTPLVGEDAMFYDVLQSYAVVCFFLALMLSIYIKTYDNQRKKLESQSIELRNMMQTDALTGTFNRRAYYEEINTYKKDKTTEDLVLVAMDVNGLKKINDLLGHSAGDEYIRAAAEVINAAFGRYGHIFRTGGDEFMALLHCSAAEAHGFEEKLNSCIASLENPWYEKMAIALGVVCFEEYPGVEFAEIEKMADKKMYENKAAYYKQNGIDRRR